MVTSATHQAIPVGRPRRANGTFLPSDERYLNRELSWLAFNARVMHEATDGRVPSPAGLAQDRAAIRRLGRSSRSPC